MQHNDYPFHRSQGKVVLFGELLLRFCPDTDSNWLTNQQLSCSIGGSEANATAALALWNVPTSYVTAIPENFLSKQLLEFLNRKGIDTSSVLHRGEKMGYYILPKGRDLKHATVIYDRQYSSFYELQPGMIDWDKVLDNASWFHFSAITPGLNENLAALCLEALKKAAQKNIPVSVDLNYRSLLWKYGKRPDEIMPGLAQYCDVVMGNVWAANQMLDIPFSEEFGQTKTREEYLQQAKETSRLIRLAFPKVKVVANTFRFDHNGQGIRYYSALYMNDELCVSKEYFAEQIIDKVGTGDCYLAGLIYGFYNKLLPDEIVNFATAAAFRKFFTWGDFSDASVESVMQQIQQS
jgi:2-dehydro-3-deoxygluconokinase